MLEMVSSGPRYKRFAAAHVDRDDSRPRRVQVANRYHLRFSARCDIEPTFTVPQWRFVRPSGCSLPWTDQRAKYSSTFWLFRAARLSWPRRIFKTRGKSIRMVSEMS